MFGKFVVGENVCYVGDGFCWGGLGRYEGWLLDYVLGCGVWVVLGDGMGILFV